MSWALVLILSLATGWFLVRALTASMWDRPTWATILAQLALGALLGPGIASIAGFTLFAVRAASPASIYAVLALTTAASGALWWVLTASPGPRRQQADQPSSSQRFPWMWVLAAALVLSCVFLVLDF